MSSTQESTVQLLNEAMDGLTNPSQLRNAIFSANMQAIKDIKERNEK